MKKLILVLSLLAIVSNTAHGSDQSKPITIEMSADDALSLVFVNAHIKVQSHSGNQAIIRIQKVSHPEVEGWVVIMQKIGNKTELSVRVPESRSTFEQIIKNEMIPLYNVEISMPQRSLELGARRGNIQVNNHNASLSVHVQTGDIGIINGEGDLSITHQEGSINLRGHRGRQHLESYSGKIIGENDSGQIDVDNFMGDTSLKQVEGLLRLSSLKGTSKVATMKGRLEYSLGRGSLNVSDLSGSLKGQSQQANVQAQIRGEADVQIQSQEGSVNLTLADSKASLQLTTQDGHITVPSFLKVTDLGTQKNVRGQLRGTIQGFVAVKSTAGSIQIH